jgi:hypothetical protein
VAEQSTSVNHSLTRFDTDTLKITRENLQLSSSFHPSDVIGANPWIGTFQMRRSHGHGKREWNLIRVNPWNMVCIM